MTATRVLLADRMSPGLSRLARGLQKSGLEVALVHDATGALARYAQLQPHLVVVAQGLPGSAAFGLCKNLKAADPAAVSLALVADVRNQRAAERAGADCTLLRPVDQRGLQATLNALRQVRELRLERASGGGPIFDPATGFYTFEHFKQQLFVEVKRARRHKLAVAIILASIEAPRRTDDPELNRVLMGGLAVAVRGSTRDTDLPVAYGEHHVLVLLPHTGGAGAAAVGRRVLFRIARSPLKHGTRRLKPRLSLGIAATAGGERQFSALVREATLRLKEAEGRGGNCVVGD
jgi:diguanylate cyclase (GGDEF)-like protein